MPDRSRSVQRGALHMVIYKGANRFYGRNSSGTYSLDVGEIRAGFLAAETAYERIRRFRAERMAQILAGNAPVSVPEGPALVFHACPVNAPDSWVRFRHSSQHIVGHLRPIGRSVGTYHFNLDGFLVAGWIRDRPPNGYVQLFRGGALEAVM